MIEIGIVITAAIAVGGWLKKELWFPTKLIPVVIVLLAVLFNMLDAWYFGGNIKDAIKAALLEGFSAIGIHSGTKNLVEGANEDAGKKLE